jgi:hypothetical protein
MARITNSDLFTKFTISGSSAPTSTQIDNLITHYYKLVYEYLYGIGTYSADDSTDELNIITSDEFNAALVGEVSKVVQEWHDAGRTSEGERHLMPTFKLSENFLNTLDRLQQDEVDLVDNIRVMGSELGDWWRVYY